MLSSRVIRAARSPQAISRTTSFRAAAYIHSRTTAASMATPYHIQVPSSDSGLLRVTQNDASAAKVSELLQKDLEQHHVFFNTDGFHNHIVHHLLTLYGTGSSPEILQQAYDTNASYQLKAKAPRSPVVEELQKDWDTNAPKYLGLGKHYSDFLAYFQAEIEKLDWQRVVNKYLFAGDERSRDLFGRLFAGFLHPMIQLMYGLEWQQPAIIAEGLAQTAIHENRLGDFLTRAETAANARSDQPQSHQPYAELFEAARNNEKLARSADFGDSNKIYDGVMVRAPDETIELLSRVKVRPEELEERTAEMYHTAAWVATTAAWHPPHVPKYDFFLIHHVNSAPIFLTINKLPWIPLDMKVRLLEWKIRMDVVQYIARGCPPLDLDPVRNYTPKDETLVSKPEELLPRFQRNMDDGHVIKLVRAMLLAQEISREYSGRPWICFGDDAAWLKAHYLLLDGVEGSDTEWVRSAGFDDAWKDIPEAS